MDMEQQYVGTLEHFIQGQSNAIPEVTDFVFAWTGAPGQ